MKHDWDSIRLYLPILIYNWNFRQYWKSNKFIWNRSETTMTQPWNTLETVLSKAQDTHKTIMKQVWSTLKTHLGHLWYTFETTMRTPSWHSVIYCGHTWNTLEYLWIILVTPFKHPKRLMKYSWKIIEKPLKHSEKNLEAPLIPN